MTKAILLAIPILFAASSTVFASDPTPLFVLFIEVPFLVVSALFLLVCIGAPKVGLVLVSLLLICSLFVLSWASGGYLDDAGGILLLSMLVDVAGIVVAAKKIKNTRELSVGDDT
ncbi:hypothetical protein SAMN02745866_04056 [Alteromonadaceae bacterium Bs31]|nr:hypothetical protein SAMN02745866_04056 [Alteromonadaceae bacterium Bs31]